MYKVGDEIVCISAIIKPGYGLTTTIGNIYVIISEDDGIITIMNDYGYRDFYNEKRFISLVEYRKLKLEKICTKLRI